MLLRFGHGEAYEPPLHSLFWGGSFFPQKRQAMPDAIFLPPAPGQETAQGYFPFTASPCPGTNPQKNTTLLELPTAYNKDVSVHTGKKTPKIPSKSMSKSPPESTRISQNPAKKPQRIKIFAILSEKFPLSGHIYPGDYGILPSDGYNSHPETAFSPENGRVFSSPQKPPGTSLPRGTAGAFLPLGRPSRSLLSLF